MKKILLFLFAISTVAIMDLNAQVIAEFDRANASGCVSSAMSTFTVANLSAMSICRGGGVNMATGGDYNSNGFDTSNGSAADAEVDGDQLTFSITPASGYEVVVTQLNIRMDRSNSGPPNYEIRAFDGATPTVISTGTISTSGGVFNIPLGTPIATTSTVSFQILVWGASGSTGTMDIEGSTFSGTNNLADPGAQILGTLNQLLPVELTSFSAKPASKRSVMLEWATASEDNNDFFAIEHSRNGVDFEEVDYVQGAGTTLVPQSYSYLHEQPAKGSNYYRLKQMDYDGAFSYSPIEVVNFQADNRLVVTPTLARQHIEVSVSEEVSEQGGLLQVFDLSGRQVISTSLNGDANQRINISELPNGHYFVRLSSERVSGIARFVKSN